MRDSFHNSHHTHHTHHTHIKRGFTLIEVLVALSILALTLVGISGMQLSALRAQQQTTNQSLALQLAAEMADAMRSNHWSTPATMLNYQAGDALPSASNCYDADCTPAAWQAFRISQWLYHVEQTLPAARVTICRDAAPWDAQGYRWPCQSITTAAIVIKLGWQETSRPSDEKYDDKPPQLVLTVGAI